MQHVLFKNERNEYLVPRTFYPLQCTAWWNEDNLAISTVGIKTFVPKHLWGTYQRTCGRAAGQQYIWTRKQKRRVIVSSKGGRLNVYIIGGRHKGIRNITNHTHVLYGLNEFNGTEASNIIVNEIHERFGTPLTRTVREKVWDYDEDTYDYVTVERDEHRTITVEEAVQVTAYPVLRSLLGDPEWHAVPIPGEISGCLRTDDIRKATRRMFGVATKPLTKAVIEQMRRGNYHRLVIARALRKLVPADYLPQIISSDTYYLEDVPTDTLVEFFTVNGMSARRILRYMTEESQWMQDTLFLWLQTRNRGINVDLSRARTFDEAHETLRRAEAVHWAEVRRRESEPQAIPQEAYGDIDGVAFGDGYRIVTPKMNTEMIDWGSQMSHCIGSYSQEAVHGRGLFFAIEHNGKVIANAQIMNDVLQQLYGNYNEYVPKEIATGFIDALMEHELLSAAGAEKAHSQWVTAGGYDYPY